MIYDLTHQIDNNLPVYPGDPNVKVEPAGIIDKDGFDDSLLTMGTHNGTHIDAPAHMINGGKKLKDYPIERFVCEAICLDARNGFDVSNVEDDKAIIFYTGACEYFNEERYWHDYRVLDKDTIKALIDKKIPLVGIDTGSFDNLEDFPVHKALLGADIILIENLTELKPLIGKTFQLYALPLKLENDGAPARVIAKI